MSGPSAKKDLFGAEWRLERYRVLSEDAGAAEVAVTRGPVTVRRLESAVESAALAEVAARVAFGPGSRTEALEEWRRRRLEQALSRALAASRMSDSTVLRLIQRDLTCKLFGIDIPGYSV